MNPRMIFPNLKTFKKEVSERFLITTREIYKQSPSYTYDDDEGKTGVLIYPSYADTQHPGKQPRFVVKIGAYNYHLMDTLSNNFSREYKNSAGVISGRAHSQIISAVVTVLVQAYAEEESSDLGDELANLAVFACRRMYSQMGLVIRNAQVSETDLINKEQDLYQTVLSISIDVPWESKTDDLGPPIEDHLPEFDEDFPEFSTYKSPGVDVYQEKKK